MPITSVESNLETLSLTVIADYTVSVERLWAAWADPRQLERFWGPEEWPATFTQHDMRPGGRANYFMTGPEGQKSHGYWVFEEVEAPKRFAVKDGFANEDGSPNDQFPGSRMVIEFEATEQGSRFVSVSTFPSLEGMETVLKMGMVEGIKSALGKLDRVLAE